MNTKTSLNIGDEVVVMSMGKILGIIYVQKIIGDEVHFDKIKVVADKNFITDKPINIISGGHQWEEYYYVTDEIKKQLNTHIAINELQYFVSLLIDRCNQLTTIPEEEAHNITNMVKIILNDINTFINERR